MSDNNDKVNEHNEILMQTLAILIKEFKNKEESDQFTDELVKDALDSNILYCKFVSEYYGTDATELADAFDEWVSQFSEEEITEMCRPNALVDGNAREQIIEEQKSAAELPNVLYSLDDIMNELNPPKKDEE